jgi:hypothetical protein
MGCGSSAFAQEYNAKNKANINKRQRESGKASQFNNFTKAYNYGKACESYEREQYEVRRDWDRKVPKVSQVNRMTMVSSTEDSTSSGGSYGDSYGYGSYGDRGAGRIVIPPAPIPDHLRGHPQYAASVNDSRRIGNSRRGP